MRNTGTFRLGWGRATWEIRFVFVPRMAMIGVGWDDPDLRPWVRRTCSVHLPCVAMVIQRPVETIDADAVTAWLHANVDRQ
jgi:hypothetical protein